MGPNRNENRLKRSHPRRQAGITAIGFLFLAAVFGFIGLAGIKMVPLFLKRMQIQDVLSDIERELPGSGKNALGIRQELDSRFYIEGIEIPRQDVSISQVRGGYQVHVQHESRAEFLGGVWFMVLVDEQVEIPR